MEPLYQQKLKTYSEKGLLSDELKGTCSFFFSQYEKALRKMGQDPSIMDQVFSDYLDLIAEQVRKPQPFEPFHKAIRHPYDYYKFGLDMVRPLMDPNGSTLHSPERVQGIAEQLAQGENVILLSNHQTEPDPQILSIMLEEDYPDLAQEVICVAGQRVVSDPFSIPYSLGRNLICIHSKKYMDHPPELKAEKQAHNRRAMKGMAEKLEEGGKLIWVAPSGGRDRRTEDGTIAVAPFDGQSVEMFRLMAAQSKRPTHFYPLALYTYDLLPPPDRVVVELGEPRAPSATAVHLYFQPEVDLEAVPSDLDKRLQRQWRADHVYQQVLEAYQKISSL